MTSLGIDTGARALDVFVGLGDIERRLPGNQIGKLRQHLRILAHDGALDLRVERDSGPAHAIERPHAFQGLSEQRRFVGLGTLDCCQRRWPVGGARIAGRGLLALQEQLLQGFER